MKRTQSAYMFFKRNAGFSYDPKTETPEQGKRKTARALAKAEVEAKRACLQFEWDIDIDGCNGCECGSSDCPCSTGEPHEVQQLTVYSPWVCGENPPRVLASLGI